MIYNIIVKRELKLIIYRNRDFLYTITLISIMLSLPIFMLNQENIIEIIPTFSWVCNTFILQSSINNLLERDYNDGILEQFLHYDLLFEFILFSKIIAHWLSVSIAISFLIFIMALMLNFDLYNAIALGGLMAINSLIVTSISVSGHALVLGNIKSVIIGQILVLPLTIPASIWFHTAFHNVQNKIYDINIVILTGLLLSIIVFSVFIASTAIKLAIRQD